MRRRLRRLSLLHRNSCISSSSIRRREGLLPFYQGYPRRAWSGPTQVSAAVTSKRSYPVGRSTFWTSWSRTPHTGGPAWALL
jgi:hypothetical protein